MIVISRSKNLHSFIQMLFIYKSVDLEVKQQSIMDFKTHSTDPHTTQSPILENYSLWRKTDTVHIKKINANVSTFPASLWSDDGGQVWTFKTTKRQKR